MPTASILVSVANNWTSEAAVDQTRRRAEKEAFEKLVVEIETMWSRVVREYAPAVAIEDAG